MRKKVFFYKKLNNFHFKKFFSLNNLYTHFIIFIGTVLIAISIHFIYSPTNLITGGVSGIGIIIERNFPKFKLSYFVYTINVILLMLSYFTLGKEYFLKTIYASILLPIILFIFEKINPGGNFFIDYIKFENNADLTKFAQLFFGAIIGAILSGTGLGIVISQNASTGGMDIIQRLLNKHLKIPFSISIYSTDGLVMLSSLLIPKSFFNNSFYIQLITLLFSGISVYLIGYFVDKFIFRGKLTYTCFVVSSDIKDLRIKILSSLQRSFTKIHARGGYSNDKKEMLVITVKRQEIYQLIEMIKMYDPQAFTFVVETKDVVGYGFKNKLE